MAVTLPRVAPRLVAVVLAAALAALVVAPSAGAQGGNPFLTPQTETQPPAPVEEEQDDDGVSQGTIFLIAGIGALLLLGVVGYIARDARRAAPVESRPSADGPQLRGAAGRRTPHTAARKQAARKKGRSAKAQRRRNRPK